MSDGWSRYYEAAGADPRPTLVEALDRFEAEARGAGTAVDLGCGTGRDTRELLRRGWHVIAVDGDAEAMEHLAALAHEDGIAGELEPLLARYDQARWPQVDLVNASFSLPFCEPADFSAVWARIRESLRPGGRFSGHLFGDRDEWVGETDMTFHSRAEVDALLDGLELERLDEIEEDGHTALGEPKRWHRFHVVARQP